MKLHQVIGGIEIIISMMLNQRIELILPDELNYPQEIYAYKILIAIVVIQFKMKTNMNQKKIFTNNQIIKNRHLKN